MRELISCIKWRLFAPCLLAVKVVQQMKRMRRSWRNKSLFNSHCRLEREGRRSVPVTENNAAAAGRSTPGGPSASSSTAGSSGRASQNQPSIPPLAFQFHQHNHQHQHTHTHQHFTPFLHPTATAPPLVRSSLLLHWKIFVILGVYLYIFNALTYVILAF